MEYHFQTHQIFRYVMTVSRMVNLRVSVWKILQNLREGTEMTESEKNSGQSMSS